MNSVLVLFVKVIAYNSKLLNKGSGSTWPGHIALLINPNFLKQMMEKTTMKVIFIVGTNGKTTTGKMITTILEKNGKSVLHNASGANLLNGIASSVILKAEITGRIKKDFAVFEVDENTLPLVLSQFPPFAIVGLNLFRDQLDRYGELDSIVKKWKTVFQQLPSDTKVILNSDDPQVSYLGNDLKADVLYFGLEDKTIHKKTLQHASDSIYCPNCKEKLIYKKVYYSHLGDWHCPHCHLTKPKPALSSFYYPLSGMYNKYNTLAAVLVCLQTGIAKEAIKEALKTVVPAFGRQEKVQVNGKNAQLFLAKNPASFNQTLATISHLGAKYVLIVLNDRIPDGRDVSWIWDIDFEETIHAFESIFVSGDRAYDMTLRLFYAGRKERMYTQEILANAILEAVENTPVSETLYILPTYSAMLDVRKILTGRKIL